MSEGKAYLIGAGPGDPELLTLKGRRLLESADVVIHDRLIDDRLLDMARADADAIDVGKTPRGGGWTQSDINALMVSEARSGKRVARLKGGDPYVFGRGGEEAAALAEAGIEFEVAPGVTSAIAAPAYAGIPLTHRGLSSSFTVFSGSLAAGARDGAEWAALARVPGTLVALMGWRNLAEIADALIANGKPPDTPAAVVSWGTQPRQRTARATLSRIADAAREGGLGAPATLVVGDVAESSEKLSWFERLPLLGVRVLVTRAPHQAGELSRRLAELGAHPIEAATIEIRPPRSLVALDDALRALDVFDWVAFTSANAVRAVFDRLSAKGRDARALGGVGVASIGKATSKALAERGIVADVSPRVGSSSALADALGGVAIRDRRVLMPRADIATGELPKLLAARGADVREVEAYRTAVPSGARRAVDDALAEGVDAVTLASSSAARNLMRLLDGDARALGGATVACIGQATAATAGRLGLSADIVASAPTMDALAQGLAERFGARR